MVRLVEGAATYTYAVQTTSVGTTTVPQAEQQEAPVTPQPQTTQRSGADSSSKIAEHSLGGQMQAAVLHSQIDRKQQKPLQIDGKITQPAPKPDPSAKPSNVPAAPSMKEVLTNAGMKSVQDRPTDAELKTYYSTKAPAYEMIAKRDYKNAAAEYRKLADGSSNPAEKERLNSVANQLDVTQTMSNAKVRNLSFPPSQGNVEGYFATLKGKPLADIKNAYESYASAFYVHSETKGVDRGDVVYAKTIHNSGGKTYASLAPEKWADISDTREMHTDGRRIVDCEGYALMGQKCFAAAGFKQVEFAVMARVDDPTTKENESYTHQHIMVTARRSVQNADGAQQTEAAVISNGTFYSGTSGANLSKDDYLQSRSQVVVGAYRETFRQMTGVIAKIPGGLVTYDSEAWVAEFDLDRILKDKNKPTPK